MQFSPYRMQLAGIRTAAVEYRPLRREVLMVGTVAAGESASAFVDAEVFDKDLPFLAAGMPVEAASDLLPGHVPFPGEVAAVEPGAAAGSRSSSRVRLRVDDPGKELRSGTVVTARAEAPVTRLGWWRQALAKEASERVAVESTVSGLPGSLSPTIASQAACLVRLAV